MLNGCEYTVDELLDHGEDLEIAVEAILVFHDVDPLVEASLGLLPLAIGGFVASPIGGINGE